MEAVKLNAKVRESKTKSELKGMRLQGNVPGTVYGKGMQSISIAVGEKELSTLLKSNRYGVFEINLQDKGKYPVIINEIQKHKVNGHMLHIDFHHVSMEEPINTTVSLDFAGKPKGVQEGGLLQIRRHDIEIKCLPNQIPAQLVVNIEALAIGENLTASQIKLPDGIELKSDPLDVVVTVLVPQKDAVADGEGEDKEASEG